MSSIKLLASTALAGAAALTLAACQDATSPLPTSRPALRVSETGNGAPSGPHYTLNIIGMAKGKSPNMTGGNGSRIFVALGSKGGVATTRINLSEGPFAVLDANGTDGTAAFQLPNPDPDGDGRTSYSVYVRALGKPGGKATMQSCYTDTQTSETWCAVDIAGGVEAVTVQRSTGKQRFVNVSKDLLYVDVCLEVDAATGECTESQVQPLFGDALKEYFWNYDNQGLRLAQLRFYPVETDAWDL